MKLIIGLGNPGSHYAKTRHNTGWRALDVLAGKAVWQAAKKLPSLVAAVNLKGAKVLLAKPQTYMNKSGAAVRALVNFYKIPLPDILIIYDDIDLLVGTTRLRRRGSSGGHQGLASVITALKTENIARLRLGIAEKTAGKQPVPAEDYVLRPFSRAAEVKIKKTLRRLPMLTEQWIAELM